MYFLFGKAEESKIICWKSRMQIENWVRLLHVKLIYLIMIVMELLLGIQINSELVMPITLSGVNLKTKVKELKQEAAERWNLPKDSLGKWLALFEDWSLHN